MIQLIEGEVGVCNFEPEKGWLYILKERARLAVMFIIIKQPRNRVMRRLIRTDRSGHLEAAGT